MRFFRHFWRHLAFFWSFLVFFGCALFLFQPLSAATSLRGDFNNDGAVNLTDYNLLKNALHTTNALYNLVDTTNYIDIFDYNELLVLIKSAPPLPTNVLPESTQTCNGSPKPARALNVGTWNIGSRGLRNRDQSPAEMAKDEHNNTLKKFDTVANVFASLQMDVLLLQEVYPTGNYSKAGADPQTNSHIQQAFEKKFPGKAIYIYGVADVYSAGQDGQVIISKYPIVQKHFEPMPGNKDQVFMNVVVQTPYGNVRVFNNHLKDNRPQYTQESGMCQAVQDLMDYISRQTQPGETYVFGGDFNTAHNETHFQHGWADGKACIHTPAVASVWNLGCTSSPCVTGPTRYGCEKVDGQTVCKEVITVDYVITGKQNGTTNYQTCIYDTYGLNKAHPAYMSTIIVAQPSN